MCTIEDDSILDGSGPRELPIYDSILATVPYDWRGRRARLLSILADV